MKLSTRRSFHRYSAASEGSEEGEINLSEGVVARVDVSALDPEAAASSAVTRSFRQRGQESC